MKILEHGNVVLFTCPKCGCVFTATVQECGVTHLFSGNIPVREEYRANCPECDEEDILGMRLKKPVTRTEEHI